MTAPFYLSLFIGPGIPLPSAQDITDALESVEVNHSVKDQAGCQLTFSLGKRSRIQQVLLPSGFFEPLACRVRIVITVGAKATPIFEGVVSQQELSPSSEAGQSKLVLSCLDLTALMDLVDLTGANLPPIPSYAVVAIVLAPYAALGVVPAVLPTPFDFIPNVLEDIKVRVGTDLAFIKMLASRVGYVFYLQPGPMVGTTTAVWGPEVHAGLPLPGLRVNMDTETNVESLSFSYDGQANYIPFFWQMLPKTNTPLPVPIPAKLQPPLGVRPAVKLRVEQVGGGTRLRPAEAALEAYKLSNSIPDAITGSVQVDVTRYPHVLKAGGLIGVQGAGITYDGLYYLEGVTHSIRRGEYMQSGSLKRNHLISNVQGVMP